VLASTWIGAGFGSWFPATEAGIPGFKRVIIGETGHRMYVEKPEEFTRAVVTFLDATVVDFPQSK
jgi:pimeloyl-ACP methyl ester carboxylesterase